MPSLAGQTQGLEGDSRIPEGLHSGVSLSGAPAKGPQGNHTPGAESSWCSAWSEQRAEPQHRKPRVQHSPCGEVCGPPVRILVIFGPLKKLVSLQVREVSYFISTNLLAFLSPSPAPPHPQGKGRKTKWGVVWGEEGGRSGALSWDPDRAHQLKRLIWLTTFFKMQIYTCGHSHLTVNHLDKQIAFFPEQGQKIQWEAWGWRAIILDPGIRVRRASYNIFIFQRRKVRTVNCAF